MHSCLLRLALELCRRAVAFHAHLGPHRDAADSWSPVLPGAEPGTGEGESQKSQKYWNHKGLCAQREPVPSFHPADEVMGLWAGETDFPNSLNYQWQNLSSNSDNSGPDSKTLSSPRSKFIYLFILIYLIIYFYCFNKLDFLLKASFFCTWVFFKSLVCDYLFLRVEKKGFLNIKLICFFFF